jgi:hypothetical protein
LEKNNNFIFLGYATKYDTVENWDFTLIV